MGSVKQWSHEIEKPQCQRTVCLLKQLGDIFFCKNSLLGAVDFKLKLLVE